MNPVVERMTAKPPLLRAMVRDFGSSLNHEITHTAADYDPARPDATFEYWLPLP
jgi:hypothetical protein